MRFWKQEEKREMVRVYDPGTGDITKMPAAELAPGMIRITLSGQEGEFWADAAKLKPSGYRHPPFSEEVREVLRHIELTLWEVYALTLEQWEDGFRRDTNFEREIGYWVHLSRVYAQVVDNRELPLAHKKEVFGLLVSCLNNPRDKVFTVVALQTMSRQEAEEVMRAFYGQ